MNAREPQPLPGVTLSEDDGVRYLHLDTPWIQGGMRIRAPQVVEIDYIQRMLAARLWLPAEALAEGAAVQLGLGAGALLLELVAPTVAATGKKAATRR
jgi:hypothetical protein